MASAPSSKLSLDQPPLRIPRKTTAALLSVSASKLRRMEQRGLLTPLRDSPKGQVYHPYTEVVALVKGRE
jgi:hypothetical protein